MDISDTLVPKSDQLDAVDLLSGPRIFTVKGVSKGSVEQPVDVHLVEFPRCWRPSKGMRRVLAACWGVDASAWVGRRVELYCDSNVRFGGEIVSGTRIGALSHISGEQRVPMIVSRGKSAVFTVQPLASASTPAEGSSRAPAGESPAQATGGAASDPAASPEPLLDAIKRQCSDMSGEQKDRFVIWLSDCGLGSKLGPIAARFGERARDLNGLVDRREMELDDRGSHARDLEGHARSRQGHARHSREAATAHLRRLPAAAVDLQPELAVRVVLG